MVSQRFFCPRQDTSYKLRGGKSALSFSADAEALALTRLPQMTPALRGRVHYERARATQLSCTEWPQICRFAWDDCLHWRYAISQAMS